MIRELSLKNFKSFKKLDLFKIDDLTIVAGKNSCGKSSILQSLLLLKQTLIKRDAGQLELEGDYLTFSNLKEISFSTPSVNRASIGYEFVVSDSSINGVINLSFSNKKVLDHYIPIVSEFKVKVLDSEGDGKRVNFLNYKVRKGNSPNFVESIISHENIEVLETETEFSSFYPSVFTVAMNYLKSNNSSRKEKISFPIEFFCQQEKRLIDALVEDIKNIKYLGPLRAMPKRAYVHFSEIATELLPSGENAAHILWARQNESVRF